MPVALTDHQGEISRHLYCLYHYYCCFWLPKAIVHTAQPMAAASARNTLPPDIKSYIIDSTKLAEADIVPDFISVSF